MIARGKRLLREKRGAGDPTGACAEEAPARPRKANASCYHQQLVPEFSNNTKSSFDTFPPS